MLYKEQSFQEKSFNIIFNVVLWKSISRPLCWKRHCLWQPKEAALFKYVKAYELA